MAKTYSIYAAVMPEVFGEGIMCFSEQSEDHAKQRVEEAYRKAFDSRYKCPPEEHFDKFDFQDRFEYYGGYTQKLDIFKVYDDSMR